MDLYRIHGLLNMDIVGGARLLVPIIGLSPNFAFFGNLNRMGSTESHPAKRCHIWRLPYRRDPVALPARWLVRELNLNSVARRWASAI